MVMVAMWALNMGKSGRDTGRSRREGEHVTCHAEFGNPPFECHSPRTMSVLLCACFTAMARTFYYVLASTDAVHDG